MDSMYDELIPDIPEHIWSSILCFMEQERWNSRPDPCEYGATTRMEMFERFCEWYIGHYGI